MFRAILLAAALTVINSAAAAASTIDFTLRTERPGQVHVQFETDGLRGGHNQWSQSIPAAELRGLGGFASSSGPAPVRFVMVRPAGRFDCAGTDQRGRAIGECRFTADPQFVSALERHGLGRTTEHQSYQLALANVGIDLVEALDRAGTRADIDGLVSCGIFRVTPELVRSYASLGYRGLTTAQLVEFQIFKVTPDYIRSVSGERERPASKALVQRRILGPAFGR